MDSFWAGFEKRAGMGGFLMSQGRRLAGALRGTESTLVDGARVTMKKLNPGTMGERLSAAGGVLKQTGQGIAGSARKALTGSAKAVSQAAPAATAAAAPVAQAATPAVAGFGAKAKNWAMANPGKALAGTAAGAGIVGGVAGRMSSPAQPGLQQRY